MERDTLKKRPDNWSWDGIIYPGAPISNLTAEIWNEFTERINAFLEYTGSDAYDFTVALRGTTKISDGLTEAIEAIKKLPGHGDIPSFSRFDSSAFIQLADAMNAVE